MGTPKITALDDFTESINLLVYGESGTGKTVLGGTAGPKGLIVATEPGTVSAARAGSKCKLTRVKDWEDFADLMTWLRTDPNGNARGVQWLIIDSLTELQDMCLRGIIKAGNAKKRREIIEKPEIQDYMVWQNRFKSTIHQLNDLPCNVLYICTSMDSENEDGDTILMPSLNGKNGTNDPTTMSKWVCGTVHAFGYLKVTEDDDKNEFRQWIFKRTGPYYGKDRYGVLTPFVKNPNLQAIARKITGNTNKEN